MMIWMMMIKLLELNYIIRHSLTPARFTRTRPVHQKVPVSMQTMPHDNSGHKTTPCLKKTHVSNPINGHVYHQLYFLHGTDRLRRCRTGTIRTQRTSPLEAPLLPCLHLVPPSSSSTISSLSLLFSLFLSSGASPPPPEYSP